MVMNRYTKLIKDLSLITQIGISMVIPPLVLIWLAKKLQARFSLGRGIMLAAILLGILIAANSVRLLLKDVLRQENRETKDGERSSFNDHE